jgi:hypothetical protein
MRAHLWPGRPSPGILVHHHRHKSRRFGSPVEPAVFSPLQCVRTGPLSDRSRRWTSSRRSLGQADMLRTRTPSSTSESRRGSDIISRTGSVISPLYPTTSRAKRRALAVRGAKGAVLALSSRSAQADPRPGVLSTASHLLGQGGIIRSRRVRCGRY